jgi:Zn-dependent metalloprotease
MANDILVHELTHGITGRLTGGGTAACLQTLEARGLGEGWSDAMAECVHLIRCQLMNDLRRADHTSHLFLIDL